jgi:hypothetical protein
MAKLSAQLYKIEVTSNAQLYKIGVTSNTHLYKMYEDDSLDLRRDY